MIVWAVPIAIAVLILVGMRQMPWRQRLASAAITAAAVGAAVIFTGAH